MTTNDSAQKSSRRPFAVLAALAIAAVSVLAWFAASHAPSVPDAAQAKHAASATGDDVRGEEEGPSGGVASGLIQFPEASWTAAGLKVMPAEVKSFSRSIALTGKVSLNEDHIAHIYPLVEGRVASVRVKFGDHVKKGDVLVVVQSQDVGKSMLELYQDRLKRDFARNKDHWTQEVSKNARELIEALRHETPIEQIEARFQNRPMGEYREKLLSAYVDHAKSKRDYERLEPLSRDGVASGKQLVEAEANRSSDRATLQAWMEEIDQSARQAALESEQALKEADTRVSVDETNLKMLGFSNEQLADINPTEQGEAIAYYPIIAPFDGTIISKDVALLERVSPESQILSIADMRTVWISADIYEESFSMLQGLSGRTVTVRSKAWPDRAFEAKVFYTGDIVEEESRTIAMRALATNDEGLLKPGMFVSVEFPEQQDRPVVQVPVSAVQEHEGKAFVFVHGEGDQFARRDVSLGRSNGSEQEVLAGLEQGEPVVVGGGFALKSAMLAELLSE